MADWRYGPSFNRERENLDSNMKHDFQSPWEEELHKRFKNLPELQAPQALIPGVMAKIENREQKSWYRQSLYNWPIFAKVVACGVLAGLGVLAFAVFDFGWNSAFLVDAKTQVESFLTYIDNLVSATGRAAVVMGRSFLGSYALFVLLIAFFSYGMFFAAGTFIWKTFTRPAEPLSKERIF